MTEMKTDDLNFRLGACVSTEIDHTKRPVTRQAASSTATPSLTVTRTRDASRENHGPGCGRPSRKELKPSAGAEWGNVPWWRTEAEHPARPPPPCTCRRTYGLFVVRRQCVSALRRRDSCWESRLRAARPWRPRSRGRWDRSHTARARVFVAGYRGPRRGGRRGVLEYDLGGFGVRSLSFLGSKAKPLLAPFAPRGDPIETDSSVRRPDRG